jgi:hypothetical protein
MQQKQNSAHLVLPLVALLLFGGFAAWWWISSRDRSFPSREMDSLAAQVRNIFQLATVEGQFSDILRYRDYWVYDISPLRKKALIRVTARVLVGFDLDQLIIQTIPDQRAVVVTGFPKARILSMETKLDYYDLTEGTFNSFSEEDLNQLQDEADRLILKRAEESDLFDRADSRARSMLMTLSDLLGHAGWELRMVSSEEDLGE